MELEKVGVKAFAAMGGGALLAFLIPVGIAVFWILKKKEKLTTVFAGAATFLIFALFLEKPIQNALLFPTQMGLPEHAFSRMINARPVLWALAVGLFPGVFEETGRLVAYKTVLRRRKNRETSVSHGIGHGGIEVMAILGLTYITDIAYGVMINTGALQGLIDKAAELAPEQAEALAAAAGQLAFLSAADVGLAFLERALAFLFHVGASILVFYACRDKGRGWLYPLAILLHTALDFIAGLSMTELFAPSVPLLETLIGAFGIVTFCGAYFLLYRRDKRSGGDR